MARFSLRSLSLNRRGDGELAIADPRAPTAAERLALFDRKAELARALRPGSGEDAERLIWLLFALSWRGVACSYCPADFARLAVYPQRALGAVCLKLAISGAESPPSPSALLAMVRREASAARAELARIESEFSIALAREPAEEEPADDCAR